MNHIWLMEERKLVNRYYVYDKEKEDFIRIDGEIAEIGEHFVEEMRSINASYLVFIEKEDYEKELRDLSSYQGGLNVGD